MTTIAPLPATLPPPRLVFDPATRQTARIAGLLYLLTFVSSIPALAFEHGSLRDAGFVVSGHSNTPLAIGAVLDMLNAIGAIGTAVVLYPLLRQSHPTLALGFVTSRLLEAATVVTSVAAILALVTLHKHAPAGTDHASLVTTGKSLVAMHDWTFLLGPGLIPGVNALLLGTVMYKTGLVPRIIPTIGLIGAPLLLASATAVMLGAFDQVSAPSGVASLPVAVWELSLGLWMTFKGFRTTAAA